MSEYIKGSVESFETEAGSRITRDSRVDRHGRASSHVVTGYTPQGRSAYYRRNISAKALEAVVLEAEAAGWSHLHGGIEAF